MSIAAKAKMPRDPLLLLQLPMPSRSNRVKAHIAEETKPFKKKKNDVSSYFPKVLVLENHTLCSHFYPSILLI